MLVAEDYVALARTIEQLLRTLGCIVVGPSPSVRRAKELASEGGLDCAVLDVCLLDGPVYPLASQLETTGIPCLFTTGRNDDADIPEDLRRVPTLVKPFAPNEFEDSLIGLPQSRDRRQPGAAT